MTDAIKLTNAERMELTRRANSRTDRVQSRLCRELEQTIRRTADRGALQSTSGPSGLGAHAGARSADPGGDAPCARRWLDALEHSQTRRSPGRQPHDGGPSLAQARPEAASDRALHGLERSGL